MAKKAIKKKVRKASVRRAVKTARTRAVSPKFDDDAKITILPAGRENPRRKGSPPYQRYEVLLKSRRVSDFLKKHPRWRTTIYRAIKDELIKVG